MAEWQDLINDMTKSSAHETDKALAEEGEPQEEGKTEAKDMTDNTGSAAVDNEETPPEANQATDNAGVNEGDLKDTGSDQAEVPESKGHETNKPLAEKRAARVSDFKSTIDSLQNTLKLALESEKEAQTADSDTPEDVDNKQVSTDKDETADEVDEKSDDGTADSKDNKSDDEDDEDDEDEEMSMKDAGYVTTALVSENLIQQEKQAEVAEELEKQAMQEKQAQKFVEHIAEKAAEDAHLLCDFYDGAACEAEKEAAGVASGIPAGAEEAIAAAQGAGPSPAGIAGIAGPAGPDAPMAPEATPDMPETPEETGEEGVPREKLLAMFELLANGQEPQNETERKLKEIMVEAGLIDGSSSEETPSTPDETPNSSSDSGSDSGNDSDEGSSEGNEKEPSKEEQNDDEEALKGASADTDKLTQEHLDALETINDLF